MFGVEYMRERAEKQMSLSPDKCVRCHKCWLAFRGFDGLCHTRSPGFLLLLVKLLFFSSTRDIDWAESVNSLYISGKFFHMYFLNPEESIENDFITGFSCEAATTCCIVHTVRSRTFLNLTSAKHAVIALIHFSYKGQNMFLKFIFPRFLFSIKLFRSKFTQN